MRFNPIQRTHFQEKSRLSLQREKEKIITLVSSSSSPAERLQWTVLAEHRGAFLAPEERETVSHRRIGQLLPAQSTLAVHNEQPVQASLVCGHQGRLVPEDNRVLLRYEQV